MINKLKSFKDIDPALPGPPTEASNGLKFAIAKKSDIASSIPKPPTTEQINSKINNTIPKV
jgi:hypothetical protein